MVTISFNITDRALDGFKRGLRGLTGKDGEQHKSKACLICDRLLEWTDIDIIPLLCLKKLQTLLSGTGPVFNGLHPSLKEHYTYKENGAEPWMDRLYLSPRGYFCETDNGFQCCKRCAKHLNTRQIPSRVTLPRFAISNGALFGYAPPELTELNDVELALVSKARANKHVFAFYGGAHKCMRGWHNLYENDVDEIARVLSQVARFGNNNLILCILLGPFTPLQKRFIHNNMMVRPEIVFRALSWLKANNGLYHDITIPSTDEVLTPYIIDKSENVNSEDNNIEARMEFSVVFPDTENIASTNGGFTSQEEFRTALVDALDTTTQTTFVSRVTPNRMTDYRGNALLCAFPLQFPYGVGFPPERGSNRNDGKAVAMSQLAYLQHMQHLSIRYFHRADFILVLHNMFERQRAVSVAYLRCKNNLDGNMAGEHFAEITVEAIKAAIDRRHSGLPVLDRTCREYLKAIDAVCKSMGQTNEATQAARSRMLSDIVRFGTSAIFLTVTPDDSNCLRIQIYVQHECGDPPDPCTATDEDIKVDYNLLVQLWQVYPGLCAFDFQQITELMIEHILGWNRNEQTSHTDGGIFGELEAWNVAIEEQGRKTLHSHWILYVKEWSKLLHGLYSKVRQTRTNAASELCAYVDSIMSTKLFGLPSQGEIATQAYKHECIRRHPHLPGLCLNQDLRNLRYAHGQSSFKEDNILKCGHCDEVFSAQKLVDSVTSNYFQRTEALLYRMRLFVKRFSSQLWTQTTTLKDVVMAKFITHATTNLHVGTHTTSCFKKGNECRNKLPQGSCSHTTVHFNEEGTLAWWAWTGVKEERVPFFTEYERHPFDVFMNQYQPELSTALGCNTNVQCGMDGGHVIYVTMYASKSNKTEDKYAYALMARSIYQYIRHRREAREASDDTEIVFEDGIRTLLTGILSHTDSVIISAPMAWFLMRNQSRFLYSHDFAYAPFDTLLKHTIPSRMVNVGSSMFVVNRLHDYIYRPTELNHLCWYEFVAAYEIVHLSARNKDHAMHFSSSEHALYHIHGVVHRKHVATPIVHYYDFPCASTFGGDITSRSIISNQHTEKFAHAVLSLFVPFRDPESLRVFDGACHTAKLQNAMETNQLSYESIVRLQNIQNCHNMMRAGRQQDILERTTEPLPDPLRTNPKRPNDATDQELEQHLDMCMSELMANIDEDRVIPKAEDDPISLSHIRKQGNNNCGFEGIQTMEVELNSCLFERSESAPEPVITNGETENSYSGMDKMVTKRILTELSIRAIRRHVANIGDVEHINPNGSVESIRLWAEHMFKDTGTDQLDTDQQRAFEVIVSKFILTFHSEAIRNEGMHTSGTQHPMHRADYNNLKRQLNNLSGIPQPQLIMFLSGAGGSGKTRVINAVLAYAKGFCKELNYVFDKRMIVVTALTGVAATLVNGETLHSAAKFYNKKITTEHIDEWKNTRLVIVDEISFATSSNLKTLNEKLGQLKETRQQKYGGLHIVFIGDFAQLEPVSGKPLYYETNFALWHDWVNCYIELQGQHRFKNDINFGNIMQRMRNGRVTRADIDCLNTRVVDSDHPNAPKTVDLPTNLKYAVFKNVNRCAINNGVFYEHITKTHSKDPKVPPPFHTLIVRSDDLSWKFNKKQFGPSARHTLWSQCADTDIKTAGERGKFVDPFLKLTTGAPLMYTENDDVPNGIANGTLCHLLKVILHANVTQADFKMINIDGYYVRTINASKVDSLLCQSATSHQTFHVRANHVACKINMPIELIPGQSTRNNVDAVVNRFPVLINYATTGHKLQGQTMESLYISEWHYGANWPYVVFSRVTTLNGLFLRTPIRTNYDFENDPRLERMLTRMKQRIPQPYDPDER